MRGLWPRIRLKRPVERMEDVRATAVSFYRSHVTSTPDGGRRIAAVVMAAGLSTRMRSATPKHFHPLLGRPMVDWVIAVAREVGADPLVVVTSPDSVERFDGVTLAVQEEPRGTGDAVAAARSALDGFDGDVFVLSGDTPLLTRELLVALREEHTRAAADATLLSFEPDTPFPYGRVIRDASGGVVEVVEEADTTAEQRAIRELNSSTYVFRAPALWRALDRLDARNAQGELQLTDAIAHVIDDGGAAAAHRSEDQLAPVGVNTRADLATAAAVLRARVNHAHMLAGVTIVDPASTWIEAEVELEADATIHPFTVLKGRSRVAAGAEVGPHAVVVDSVVGEHALVGPFCYLRPGTVLEERAKAGAFVEIKNSHLGRDAKVPHSSYVGDADVGEGANVAAGNITANYSHHPDREKGRTVIGRNVRTGVDNAFVAPVEIGEDAWLAPGSVITEDVPPGSLAGFPPRQVTKEGWVYDKRDDDPD
jgi:bifunctional UDP-N-acetylglucosamine pyrophosphorylase/glucosamine-1-phosphate N-acetyltransferase